eukprot:7623902-Pyramimonas_sp.AAC.1
MSPRWCTPRGCSAVCKDGVSMTARESSARLSENKDAESASSREIAAVRSGAGLGVLKTMQLESRELDG